MKRIAPPPRVKYRQLKRHWATHVALFLLFSFASLLLGSSVEAAVCRSDTGQPVACNAQPEGGGAIYSCSSYPRCCEELGKCWDKYSKDVVRCNTETGAGKLECIALSSHNRDTCSEQAALDACP